MEKRINFKFFLFLGWLVSIVTGLQADTLITLDGPREGSLAGWPAQGPLSLASGEKLSRTDFIAWQSRHVVQALPGQIQVVLTNQVSLRGEPVQWTTEGVTLETQSLGVQKLSFDDIWAILFLDHVSSRPLQEKLLQRMRLVNSDDNDVLFLRTDHIEGLLDRVQEDKVFFDLEDEIKTFEASKVYGVKLANPLDEVSEKVFLTTRAGDRFPLSDIQWQRQVIKGQSPQGPVAVPHQLVSSFEFANPQHQFLGNLKPFKVQEALPNEEVPGVYPWPYQINKSVHHRETLRLNDQVVKQGIGVHSDSRLSWKLSTSVKEIAGACGLGSEALGKGSVHFRLWGDGQKLFDSGLMTGKDVAKRFRVPLKGVKELTLEVVTDPDSEEKNYTLDRAIWADLILVTS